MGSCVSVHKEPESALGLKISFRSTKNGRLSIPSPVKQTSQTAGAGDRAVADVAIKSQWFRPGSKDEAFFDSQPWMDSDCEDDFVSVCGDFTPSCGCTPVHPSCTKGGILQVNEPLVVEGTPDSETVAASPYKKKRLSDLFKESLRIEHYADGENTPGGENLNAANIEGKGTNSVHLPNGITHLAKTSS